MGSAILCVNVISITHMFATLRHTTNIKLRQLHLRQRELNEFRKAVNDKALADSREADKVLSLLHQMLEWGV